MSANKVMPAAAILCASLLSTAGPALADGHRGGAHAEQGAALVITVSCYRGPWEEVIWDRPNPEFLDSLTAVGYSLDEAQAIGDRVCRDPSAVNRPDRAQATMYRILAENPPRG